MTDSDEQPVIPLESLDEETRRQVLNTRRDIKIIGAVSIGLIVLMMVLVFVGVALAFAD